MKKLLFLIVLLGLSNLAFADENYSEDDSVKIAQVSDDEASSDEVTTESDEEVSTSDDSVVSEDETEESE